MEAEAAALRAKATAKLQVAGDSPVSDPLLVKNRFGRPADLCNLWGIGSAAFLLGGGPSLAQYDLTQLGQRGVMSLGINNVAAFAQVRAFVATDQPRQFHDAIWNDPSIMKFVPAARMNARTRTKRNGVFVEGRQARRCPNVWQVLSTRTFEAAGFFDGVRATWGNNGKAADAAGRPRMLSTMLLAFRVLHYLGVRRVYLLGGGFFG